MSEGYSIEFGDEIVGIIVRNDGERYFRFHSAVKDFKALDGLVFQKPRAAELAVRAYATHGQIMNPNKALAVPDGIYSSRSRH
ncbi:MAG: hypothetical protein P8Y67_02520 [Alphaproteobacteria bacterium]|jgi:hypothetical protein